MKSLTKLFFGTLITVALIFLSGCSSSDPDIPTLFSLDVTDAPVDNATEVVVEFTGVEIKPASSDAVSFDFATPRQLDLLALQGGDAASLLNDVEVEPGSYQWIRLKVNAQMNTMDSYISFEDGSTFSLFVPSGNASGLKLVQGFVIPVGTSASFTIDFDLRKSVVNPVGLANDYFLKPALRLLDNNEIGDIKGTVDNAIAEQEACSDGSVVYIYEGHDVVADDEGSPTPPLTSATVEHNIATNTYEFTVAFLSPADYTLALTCEAGQDSPETDDEILFIASLNATVAANQTTTVGF